MSTRRRAGTTPAARIVRQAARSHWANILPVLGVPVEALRLNHGPCPGCGGRDRYRFDDLDGAGTWICSQGGGDPLAGDGFALLRHVHGWTFPETLHAVAEALGMGLETRAPYERPTHRTKLPERQPRAPERNEKAAASLRRVWAASEVLDLRRHAVVRRYFEARGLGAIIGDQPADLRFHPSLDYWETDDTSKPRKLGEYPALLGVVRAPDGQPVSIHRLYLAKDGRGKAPVPSARKLMTPATPRTLAGGAIRLYSFTDTLAFAEGLETAFAARVLDPSRPVWSAVNSSGLAALVIPPGVREVVILADHDRAGLDATRKLAGRLLGEGRRVRVAIPPQAGCDWNDSLQHASIRRAAA